MCLSYVDRYPLYRDKEYTCTVEGDVLTLVAVGIYIRPMHQITTRAVRVTRVSMVIP